MSNHLTSLEGCARSVCQCDTAAMVQAPTVARINGIVLHVHRVESDHESLRQMAYAELLRQQAVKCGLLPELRGLTAPELSDADRKVIESMVDQTVVSPLPTQEECQRYFDANTAQFVLGQALHVRHILLAVTPGVNVHALAVQAEKALVSLLGKDVPAERFAQLAAELSNCPTGLQGGDLGWIGPDDCAPELANELFHQKHSQWGMGVHPRLVHTRYGFHIIEVMGRRKGTQKTYAQVQERIAAQLSLQSRAKALHQYMSLLVGQAVVEGIDLAGSDSLLVQ